MAKFRFDEYILHYLSKQKFQFIWDNGNSEKNLIKHGITCRAAEEVFFDEKMAATGIQILPPCNEDRYGVIGKTLEGSILFVSFTIRLFKIRVISARQASKNERNLYEKKIC